MNKNFFWASSVFFFSGIAVAMPPAPPSFENMDVNSDGVISSDEAQQDHFLAEHFSTLDKNADGSISEDEMKSGHGPGKGGPGGHEPMTLDTLDANGDGKISKDEAASDPFLAEHFSDMDADGSGYLSSAEMKPGKPPVAR